MKLPFVLDAVVAPAFAAKEVDTFLAEMDTAIASASPGHANVLNRLKRKFQEIVRVRRLHDLPRFSSVHMLHSLQISQVPDAASLEKTADESERVCDSDPE